jgi:hypothetical protein
MKELAVALTELLLAIILRGRLPQGDGGSAPFGDLRGC